MHTGFKRLKDLYPLNHESYRTLNFLDLLYKARGIYFLVSVLGIDRELQCARVFNVLKHLYPPGP